MIFNLPSVEFGVIMIKMHSWTFYPPAATNGWCSENNKEPCPKRALSSFSNSTSMVRERSLKPPVPSYCDDFMFEFAIDGEVTSWNKDEFVERQRIAQRVVEFWTLLDEDSWGEKRDVELAIRITGCGRQKPLDLTHIYWI